MDDVLLPLWVGTIGMALGTIAIVTIGARAPRSERHHVLTSMSVTAIAATAYFAMTQERLLVQVADNTVYAARYLDWVLTTPLLLLGLLLIAMPRTGTPVDRTTLIAGVLGADVFMIATGFLAATSDGDAARWVFYTVSCLAFLAILVTAWGPLTRAAQEAGTGALYRRLLSVLSVLWLVYPVLWVLGTEGSGALGLVGEVWVFAVIDVSAKVLFGLLLVSGVARLPQRAAVAAH